MRSPTSLLLPLLALTTTTTAAATAQQPRQQPRQQQQQQQQPSRPPIVCAAPSPPPPSGWPGYAFTLQHTLNYDFLSAQPAAAAQLCQAGGSVVDYAVGAASSSASTWGIEAAADEVAESLGYAAAVLVVRAPAGLLAELNDQVGNATSRLYGNPDGLAGQVAAQIDDAFEVVLREGL